ncbi:MAG TPA: CBS domain-containing protein [Pyrinomonadaceae bacterium]|nr:CBS domain-containing protein [Pyrinomonadaceae bacterium]
MLCPDCGHDNIEGMDRCENCMKPLRDLDVPRSEATAGLVRSVMEDDLRGLLEDAPALRVGSDTPAREVVRRMKEGATSCALVVDSGKLSGIFTEHDVLRKLAGGEAVKIDTPISELMTSHPDVLKETDSIASALNKMAVGRYRNVPVETADGSYRLISIRHVLKYIAQEDW